MEKDAADNEAKGKEYREKFAKEKGVKTSSTGLVYQVVEAGKGEAPKDSDTVVVNYKPDGLRLRGRGRPQPDQDLSEGLRQQGRHPEKAGCLQRRDVCKG